MSLRTKLHPLGGNVVQEDPLTPSGTVIWSSRTAGTFTVNIPTTQNYWIDIRGGGGGNAYAFYGGLGPAASGGAGGHVYGLLKLNKGTYSIGIGGAGAYSETYSINVNATGGTGGTSYISGIASAGGGGGAVCGVYYNGYYVYVGAQSGGGAGGYSIVSGITGLTGVDGGSELGSQTTGLVYIEAK